MTEARSPIRALRAALFAAVCVTLSAVGHSAMSAHSLPPRSLLTAFAVTAALAWAAAGRRQGALPIGGGLVAVQTALHLIFSAGHSGHSERTERWGRSGHGGTHHGDTAGSAGSALGPQVAEADLVAAGHVSTGMLAAHLLAALACGLWLARGEAALFALGRAVGALAFTPLRLLFAAVRAPELPHPVRPRTGSRPLHGVVLAHTLSRRGPPRPAAPRATVLGAHV